MENEEKLIKSKTESIKKWFKDPTNLTLISIIVIALVIRIIFFVITKNQPLWWDEAEYMATAKHWAFNVPYNLNPQRPPLFQLLAALFLKMGFSEAVLRFILVVIPSVFVVFATYLFGKELYNKKIGLIAAACSIFMWSFLFWTGRFQPDFLSMSFQILALYCFWKLFKHQNYKLAIWAGVFASLGFYFKISALLVPLIVLIFIIWKEGLSFVKNKYYWVALLSFVVVLLPFFIWQYSLFGNPLAFAPSYSDVGGKAAAGWGLGWMALSFFYIFPKVVFFILFILGIATSIFSIALISNFFFKDKEKRFNPDIFSIISLIIISAFYVYFIRGVIEDRWIFLIFPFTMFFAARGITFISDIIAKNKKWVLIVLVLVLLIFYAYPQLKHTNEIVKLKLDSYGPVKDASLWIKDNSLKTDSIVSISYTQATSYSEREVIGYYENVSEFDQVLEAKKPKYLMVSVFERHPPWMNDWITQNKAILEAKKAYFADQTQQQALLIVYQIKY